LGVRQYIFKIFYYIKIGNRKQIHPSPESMTLSSGAEVLFPGTEAAEVADTMIEALLPSSIFGAREPPGHPMTSASRLFAFLSLSCYGG
jgi:hypothetical protein